MLFSSYISDSIGGYKLLNSFKLSPLQRKINIYFLFLPISASFPAYSTCLISTAYYNSVSGINYEISHYVIFSIFLSLPSSYKYFSKHFCFKTLAIHRTTIPTDHLFIHGSHRLPVIQSRSRVIWRRKGGCQSIMNFKGCGGKQSWPNFRYYPGIYLESLRKNIVILRDDRSLPVHI
jgi:hypothetical protein